MNGISKSVKLVFSASAISLMLGACGNDEHSADSAAVQMETVQTKIVQSTPSLQNQSAKPEFKPSIFSNNDSHANTAKDTSIDREESDDALEMNNTSESNTIADYQADQSKLTVLNNNDGYIEWAAPSEVNYSEAEITVVTPSGERFKQSFTQGEQMVIDTQLADGVYQWESVVIPEVDSYTREEMRTVRESGDQRAEQELLQRLRTNGNLPTEEQAGDNRQSGAFTVIDGIARPIGSNVSNDGQDREI